MIVSHGLHRLTLVQHSLTIAQLVRSTTTNFTTTLTLSITTTSPLFYHDVTPHLLQLAIQCQANQTGGGGRSNSTPFREEEDGKKGFRIRGRLVRLRSFDAPPSLTTCSPTGWHGESGAAKHGGHVTVKFIKANGYYKKHHVYPTDEAYKRKNKPRK